MPKVSNDEFFARLHELFEQSKQQGSVYLQLKRLEDPSLAGPSESPFAILFRASNGRRHKADKVSVSTAVSPADLPVFWQKYSDSLKKGAAGLRKKEKKEKRKLKKKE